MMTAMRVIGQRERNHDRYGEIRIVRIVIIRGDRKRKSMKCIKLKIMSSKDYE